MTNKEEEDNPPCDSRAAAFLALHLVSQVLDEAFVIANEAKDSGQPWQYLPCLKNLRSLTEFYVEDSTFTISKGDSQYLTHCNIENLSNAIVTSTPQKYSVNSMKSRNESNFVGQGDEQLEVSDKKLRKPTSTWTNISQLFDMSDVEHVNSCDESHISTNNISPDHSELSIKAMTKIIESCINNVLKKVSEQEGQGDDSHLNYGEPASVVTDESKYSFFNYEFDTAKDISLNINDKVITNNVNENLTESKNENKQKDNNDVSFYENAYLTLNRDYDQNSEEYEPDLQDPKTMPMQEVQLLTPNKSAENIEKTELGVSENKSTPTAGSRKSNIVRRCRMHGARLLSCLRGWWWRRKLPGKRKNPRAPGSIRGLCPLSPNARRRGASLLDQRNLRAPSPSKFMAWKFNTVNEALVHSSRWKEFGFKMSLNKNDEF